MMYAHVRSLTIALAVCVFAACSADDGNSAPSSTTASSSSSASSAVVTDTTGAGQITVQVFFVDQDAFNQARPPYATPVERVVSAQDSPRAALDAIFAGPTKKERADGLRLVASGASGVGDLRIENGTAHVALAGGCSSGGSTLTIAEQIFPTLLQFEGVQSVKIYDPEGRTESPSEPGDSIPECLEP